MIKIENDEQLYVELILNILGSEEHHMNNSDIDADLKEKKRKKNLKYIKIDSQKKLEILEEEMMLQLLMDFINSLARMDNNNIDELNKFFIQILPENKESDILKVNYALSERIRNMSRFNKIDLEKQHENYMTEIMNLKIDQEFVLTSKINEKLSIILSMIYKKIKKIKKFNKFEDFTKYIKDISLNTDDIFKQYKIKDNDFYKFREFKTDKKIFIPMEVLILRQKFKYVKKFKLNLKKNFDKKEKMKNNILLLEEKDIINNIFILLNLEWLFPYYFEIGLDLTNEFILKDKILLNIDKYEIFLKKINIKNKNNYYQNENKKIVNDINKKSMFAQPNENNLVDEFKLLNESISMISSVKDEKLKQENYIKKYMPTLEMVIVYWYFISKNDNIRFCDFKIPINLEDDILKMFKEKKIYLFNFNLLNGLTSENLIEAKIDFNSLDYRLLEQIYGFLVNIKKIRCCRLSFFSSEEYFEPQFLLNLLLNLENTKDMMSYVNEIRSNEELENFLLRKLSVYFEININKFFVFFTNKRNIKELYLIFDMPNILNKIDNYEIIIIKLIMNIFIDINKFNKNNSNEGLECLSIIADNLFLDNIKYPFLNIFFNYLNIYRNKNILIKKFTLKLKIIGITNIYKIISYHINHLTIGSFDLDTLRCFIEYITSTEFKIYSEIISLQITLNNNIKILEQCFYLFLKLLINYPKNLREISIYSNIQLTDYMQIVQLLKNTNYNKIEKIFLQFNKKSLDNINMKKIYGINLEKLKDNIDNNFMDLFFVKKSIRIEILIIEIMYKIGKKYNNNFMDYNIFLQLEKFICDNGKKQIIVQYK